MNKTITRIVGIGTVEDVQYGINGEYDWVPLRDFDLFEAIPDPYTYDPWEGVNDFTTYIPAITVPARDREQGDTYDGCELHITVELMKDEPCGQLSVVGRTAEQAAALLRADMALEHMSDAGCRVLDALKFSGCEDTLEEFRSFFNTLVVLANRIDREMGIYDPEELSEDGEDD